MVEKWIVERERWLIERWAVGRWVVGRWVVERGWKWVVEKMWSLLGHWTLCRSHTVTIGHTPH